MSTAKLNHRPGGGYSRHVGRIGALAVALGVGVLFGPGVAWADDTAASTGIASDNTPTNATEPESVLGRGDSSSSGTESQSSSGSSDTSDDESEGPEPSVSSPSQSETKLDAGVIVRSSGGAHKSDATDTELPGDDASGSDSTTDDDPPATDAGGDSTDPPAAEVPAVNESGSEHSDLGTTTGTQALKVASAPAKKIVMPTAAQRLALASADAGPTAFDSATTMITMSASSAAAPTQQATTTVAAPVVPVQPMLRMAAFLLDSALAPFVENGPLTPTNSPVLWTVLAWVRRQLEPYLPHQQQVAAVPAAVSPVSPVDPQEADPDVHQPGDPEGQVGLSEEFERQVLVEGLVQPTDFRFLPDGSILIAEKGGAIKLFHDGHVNGEPVITLVTLPTDTDEERGLLGIEIDPNFEDNGYLYVSYTTAQNRDRLSRFTVVGETAELATELVLLESDQPGNIYHHGGEVHFGPDGKLYWAMGMNTYNPNSQNLSNVHGKILRLNPDGTVPADNPFINTPGAVPQIWAYGLRNPFRFTFTHHGQLLSGDVGGDAFEELNIVTRGANYGWPSAEGVCDTCGHANPIYTYEHTPAPAKAGSITAVMEYTGDTFPDEYEDKVFIADYTLGWIKVLTFDHEYSSFISEEMFDDSAGTVVKLAQGPDGNIYQLNIFPGTLSRIAPSGGNRAPSAVITATKTNGLAPLAIDFSSAGSSDPDPNTTLTYAWDFGDGGTSTAANPSRTYTTNGPYNVTLTVSDGQKTGQATQRIVVGSTAPTADITTPTQNSPYSAGDVISFTGIGTDAQDAVLPDSAYKWTVVFHHAAHVHPFRDNIIGKSGSVEIPRSADNIDTTYYRITLTVTDSSGLSTTDSVDIKPRLATMTFNASDPDATYTIDGIPHKGLYTEQGVVGVERVIGAVSPQYTANGQFVFNNWSDGQAASHTVVTPTAGGSYTINYDEFTTPPTPWHEGDVGHPTVAGYSSYDNGVFTVSGAGGDIWGPTDEFHYVYQGFSGDGTIIARVTSQTDTDDWAKSGIIVKESTAAGSKYVMLAVTPENGTSFQYNFNGDGGSAPYTLPNAWLKLEREGDVFRGYSSANGTDWTLVGETTLAMNVDVTAGLAVTSHKFDTLNTTRFDNVSVVSGGQWTSVDVGAPLLAGSTVNSGGTYTVVGGGDDIWGTADQMHLTYRSLPGDGELVAHVASFTGTSDGWAKAGVIVKQSATAGAPYALLATTPANGVNFQHGFDSNVAAATTGGWLKVVREGNTVTGLISADGVQWTEVSSATVELGDDAIIGLFVSSHDGSTLATATFDHVSLVKSATSSAVPAPWVNEDVGAPRLSGSATHTAGVYTVNGAGDDIWDTADQFHFVHQTLSGDGEIVARVTAQESGTNGWAKSGVMIKDTSEAGAPYALLAVTPAHGVTMQHGFNVDDGEGTYTAGNAWLKLKRTGTQLTGYTSADGITWTSIGTATVDMGEEAEIGLFVTSHNGSQVNTSTFDNVVVTSLGNAAVAV